MKKSKIIPVVIAFFLLCTVIGFSLNTNKSPSETIATDDSVNAVKISSDNQDEMRGIWVSYLSLDMSSESDKSENAFKQKFDSIVKKSKDSGFNTLIVQVRPFGDALYKSRVFPISHILTGTQGDGLSYDPLTYMCEAAHKNGLKIQAWVNPYRISLKDTPANLSKDNPYVQDNSLGVVWDNGIYYNPSLKEVRNLIVEGIKEIVKNYDVDGIQFDDYFYPTADEDFDKTQYNAYKKSLNSIENALSLENWRTENVNVLIADTYKAIHSIKDNVVFGISPQGNLDNNKKLYADVCSWCTQKGYIDYICPQIYFSLDNPSLTFEDSLNQWKNLNMCSNIKNYVGLAGYKAGSDSDSGTWLDNDDILMQEIQICREKKADGFMLYSYEALLNEQNSKEIQNVIKLIT